MAFDTVRLQSNVIKKAFLRLCDPASWLPFTRPNGRLFDRPRTVGDDLGGKVIQFLKLTSSHFQNLRLSAFGVPSPPPRRPGPSRAPRPSRARHVAGRDQGGREEGAGGGWREGGREGLAGRPLDAFAQKLARAISDANVFHVRGTLVFRDAGRRPARPVTPAHSLPNPDG